MTINEDYLLRSMLNTQRYMLQVDMLAGEMRVWDEEINILELMRSNELMRGAA